MRARSLRSRLDQKLQRESRLAQQHNYEVTSSQVSYSLPRNMLASSPAYDPAFFLISSSEFGPLFPPAPAAVGPSAASNHAVPTGAIVGGSIASFVALAATATIVAAVYRKTGLNRLLGPIYCKLLSSSFFGKLFQRVRSDRLKSLCKIFRHKWHSQHRRHKSKEADHNDTNEGSSRADSDHGDFLDSGILGNGGPSARASKRESNYMTRPDNSSPTILELLEDIGNDQVEQLQTTVHDYLVTTASEFVESELEEAKEEIRQQPAESLIFSVAEIAIDDLQYLNDEVGKIQLGNADDQYSGEASKEELVAAMWQPVNTALSIVEEAIEADLASKSSSTIRQESEPLAEEGALHRKRRGSRRLIANPDVEVDVSGQEKLMKQAELIKDDSVKSGKVYEQQKSSAAELQVIRVETANESAPHKKEISEGASANSPASHKQETSKAAASGDTHSLALVPTTDKGGIVRSNIKVAPTKAITPVPSKRVLPMQRKLRTSTRKGKSARHEVILKASSKKHKQAGHGIVKNNMAGMGTMIPVPTKALVPVQKSETIATHRKQEGKDAMSKASKSKHKRPSNLGHVSFSCEMSAHRLRFFTSCMSGGTYGPPLSSLDHSILTHDQTEHLHPQDMDTHPQDMVTHPRGHQTFPRIEEPYSTAHRQLYVPLHNAYQYNLMHQQQYDPSNYILAQQITSSQAPSSMQHIPPMPIAHVEFIRSPPKSSNIDDYGDPFDGVL